MAMHTAAEAEDAAANGRVLAPYLRAVSVRPVVGYSCLSAWTQAIFSDRFADVAHANATTIAAVHMGGSALALLASLVLVLMAHAIAPVGGRRLVVAAMGVLGALAAGGLILADQGTVGSEVVVVCNGAAAVASVWLVLAWYERLAVWGIPGLLGTFGAASILSSLLYFVAMAPLGVGADLLLAVLPLVAAALLMVPGSDLAADCAAEQGPGSKDRGSLLRMVVPLLVIVGLANYANGTYLNLALDVPLPTGVLGLAYASVSRALTVLAAVVLAALCVGAHTRVAFCISTGCVLVASLITFAWPEAPIQLLLLLVHAGVELMGFLTLAVLVEVARHRGATTTRFFALYSVALFSGTLAGQLSSALFSHSRPFTALLLMAVLVAMLMLAFMAHDSIARPLPMASLAVLGQGEVPEDPLGRVAEQSSLSPRELDVARLWVAGHNSAYIEETLGISKHTVRTHLKNIYGKTRTANKEELIRLVEQTGEGAGAPTNVHR